MRDRREVLGQSASLLFLYEELLGRRDVSTTMIYTHVLNQGGRGVRSPLDALVQMDPHR